MPPLCFYRVVWVVFAPHCFVFHLLPLLFALFPALAWHVRSTSAGGVTIQSVRDPMWASCPHNDISHWGVTRQRYGHNGPGLPTHTPAPQYKADLVEPTVGMGFQRGVLGPHNRSRRSQAAKINTCWGEKKRHWTSQLWFHTAPFLHSHPH